MKQATNKEIYDKIVAVEKNIAVLTQKMSDHIDRADENFKRLNELDTKVQATDVKLAVFAGGAGVVASLLTRFLH